MYFSALGLFRHHSSLTLHPLSPFLPRPTSMSSISSTKKNIEFLYLSAQTKPPLTSGTYNLTSYTALGQKQAHRHHPNHVRVKDDNSRNRFLEHFKGLIFVCLCVGACVIHVFASGPQRPAEGGEILELVLQAIVSFLTGVGNGIRSLWKSSSSLNC